MKTHWSVKAQMEQKLIPTIRSYQSNDATELAHIFYRSVRGIAPTFYSTEQLEAWASIEPHAQKMHEKFTDGRSVLLATDEEGRPVAFIDLESDGHIDLLFCAPEASGKGIATRLYTQLEELALKRNIPRLYVESSEVALRFFQKQGFNLIARRDFTLRSVAMHNYAMEKIL